jgi:hypothetical protein
MRDNVKPRYCSLKAKLAAAFDGLMIYLAISISSHTSSPHFSSCADHRYFRTFPRSFITASTKQRKTLPSYANSGNV